MSHQLSVLIAFAEIIDLVSNTYKVVHNHP